MSLSYSTTVSSLVNEVRTSHPSPPTTTTASDGSFPMSWFTTRSAVALAALAGELPPDTAHEFFALTSVRVFRELSEEHRARRVHQVDRVGGGARQAAQGATCGHRADEDAGVERQVAHADAIAEDRATGERRGRIDGDLNARSTKFGTTSFPRLRAGNAEKLSTLLIEKYETAVVPGRFFESPDHIRIGMCCDPTSFNAGTERLGQALDELAR